MLAIFYNAPVAGALVGELLTLGTPAILNKPRTIARRQLTRTIAINGKVGGIVIVVPAYDSYRMVGLKHYVGVVSPILRNELSLLVLGANHLLWQRCLGIEGARNRTTLVANLIFN